MSKKNSIDAAMDAGAAQELRALIAELRVDIAQREEIIEDHRHHIRENRRGVAHALQMLNGMDHRETR